MVQIISNTSYNNNNKDNTNSTLACTLHRRPRFRNSPGSVVIRIIGRPERTRTDDGYCVEGLSNQSNELTVTGD